MCGAFYAPTLDWPSLYNGVTPDSSFGLELNNIGIFQNNTIYTCIEVLSNGIPASSTGTNQIDVAFEIFSLPEATIKAARVREFNSIYALNENAELPDCSGTYEITTKIYSDIIQYGDQVLQISFVLDDPINLIFKLKDLKYLSAL